ncbi:hypothetical protein A3863_10365 [Priestia endophytica]|uniref:hypothetical protein n=1 Tax=Priestia endophytica TaxID=135735 RepID=UPI000DCA4DC9|nr:hypothetical protein [Priestia endophytica]RAS89614.1 hypothetical protein A3863_10365 [Priestia endophytica]
MKTVTNYDEFEIEFEEFLRSDNKYLFFHGNSQEDRHLYILKFVKERLRNRKILFRTNSLENATDFARLKKGKASSTKLYSHFNNNFYFDSYFTDRSMTNTPDTVDIAIIYPLEGLIRNNKVNKLFEDINDKNIRKVVFVSWLDEDNQQTSYDYSDFINKADIIIKIHQGSK